LLAGESTTIKKKEKQMNEQDKTAMKTETPNMKTETPITDANLLWVDCCSACHDVFIRNESDQIVKGDICPAEISRKLERELNELKKRMAAMLNE
jgi:hypothetical protein